MRNFEEMTKKGYKKFRCAVVLLYLYFCICNKDEFGHEQKFQNSGE